MSPTLVGPARVVVVCGEGTCRSPMAVGLLAPGLGDGVDVVAAGLRAVRGTAVVDGARGPVLEHGGSLDALGGARPADPALLAGADLVLAVTRGHAAAVARAAPRAARWTFTLRELARLLEGRRVPGADPAARVRAAARVAAPLRTSAPPPRRPEDDDVPDPMSGPAGGFADSGAVVAAACAALVRALGPTA